MNLDDQNAERVTALLDALPPVIRVGAHDIAIVQYGRTAHNRLKNFAEFSEVEQKIYLDPATATASLLAAGLLHETNHAIWWESNLEKEETEERVAFAFGNALIALHRDNPWLAPWLTMATAPLPKPLAFDVEAAIRGGLATLAGTEKPPHCNGIEYANIGHASGQRTEQRLDCACTLATCRAGLE